MGSGSYVCAAPGAELLRRRLGPEAPIRAIPYGERMAEGDAIVSFHPAGHILGSAQIRIEHGGEVWVFSGDYKRAPDPTCTAFEPLRCDVFVTESTFALPVYRWETPSCTATAIFAWWEECRANGRAALLVCYPLGKTQRILAELTRFTDRTVLVHGTMDAPIRAYRDAGIAMLPTTRVVDVEKGTSFAGELILAPPSAPASPWARRFKNLETGFASGWMRVRGARRRRGFDIGFALSDHADWPDLLATIAETGARRVLAVHGFTDTLARHLRDQGLAAQPLRTPYDLEAAD
jgi:putative mRNA 3-end processing factor